jgi:hypothetical protein
MSGIPGLLGPVDCVWRQRVVGLANLAERDPAAARQKVPAVQIGGVGAAPRARPLKPK